MTDTKPWNVPPASAFDLRTVNKAAFSRGLDGVLVKAQAGAEELFFALGLQRVPVEDHRQDYALRFWKPVKGFFEPAHGESARKDH